MASVVAKGIDVSHHQKTVDWEKVKAAGIQFAIIRAGFGRNNIDPYFKRNITECARLGIPVGIFWFSYALNEAEAKKEAEYCLAAIEPYEIERPVYARQRRDADKKHRYPPCGGFPRGDRKGGVLRGTVRESGLSWPVL